MVIPDLQQITRIFLLIQNIHLHGFIHENIPKEWVTVEDLYRKIERPKLPKDELRDFCEYQASLGNLEKRTGRDKEVRQASAEYKVSEKGLGILAVYNSTKFEDIKNMFTWSRGLKLSHQEINDEENTSDSTSKPKSS